MSNKKAKPIEPASMARIQENLRLSKWMVRRRFNRVHLEDLVSSGVVVVDDASDEGTTVEDVQPATPKRRRREPKPARQALIEAAIEHGLSRAQLREILRAQGKAVVIIVPSPSWVHAVSNYLESLIAGEHFARESAATKKGGGDDNGTVALALADGRNVIGVSHSERLLPSLLIRSADIRVVIPAPRGVAVAKAICASLGGRLPKDLTDDFGAGLDLDELVAAIRRGSTASEAIERIRSLALAGPSSLSDSDLPRLKDAGFYGAAQRWALDLVVDIESARRGDVDFRDISRAAVFYGPPGTGKTVLARMIANEARIPIVESSIGELFASSPGYLDSVIKAQRAAFAKAAALAPSVLFWDELDGLPNRATMSVRGRDWWLPVVDDFILQVSNLPSNIVLLGATNLIENVDAALLRPGRFGQAIEIKAPTTPDDLAGILRFHLGHDLADVDLIELAHFGIGATAAQAMEWVRAARHAARIAKRPMAADHLRAQILPPEHRGKDELMRSAHHEAGHAVVALALGMGAVDHVSLISDGETGGRMRLGFLKKYALTDRESIERYVMLHLGGRAAEIVFFGSGSAGAGGTLDSDLGLATKLVTAIHTAFGLGGHLTFRAELDEQLSLMRLDPGLRDAVEYDLQKLLGVTEQIVRRHSIAAKRIASELLKRRFLRGAEVKAIFVQTAPKQKEAPI